MLRIQLHQCRLFLPIRCRHETKTQQNMTSCKYESFHSPLSTCVYVCKRDFSRYICLLFLNDPHLSCEIKCLPSSVLKITRSLLPPEVIQVKNVNLNVIYSGSKQDSLAQLLIVLLMSLSLLTGMQCSCLSICMTSSTVCNT